MDAKLDKISELSNILCEKESLGQKIVAVSHDFELGKLMRQAHITKDQGVPCSALLLYLLLIRLLEISVFCFYKAKWFVECRDREELLLSFPVQSVLRLAQPTFGYSQAVSPHSGETWGHLR